MHYMQHNFADYALKTQHLSALEDAFYRRARDLYLVSEAPLPLDEAQLYRLLRATSRAEQRAVQVVVGELFCPFADGWHDDALDDMVEAARERQSAADETARAERERRARSNAERKALAAAARAAGLRFPWNVTSAQLRDMLAQAQGVDLQRNGAPLGAAATQPRTAIKPISSLAQERSGAAAPAPSAAAAADSAAASCGAPAGFEALPLNSQQPAKSQPLPVELAAQGEEAAFAAVAVAMQAQGLRGAAAGDAMLRQLVRSGAEVAEFVEAAQAAVVRKKGLGWALQRVAGKRADAAALAGGAAPAAAGVPSEVSPPPPRRNEELARLDALSAQFADPEYVARQAALAREAVAKLRRPAAGVH